MLCWAYTRISVKFNSSSRLAEAWGQYRSAESPIPWRPEHSIISELCWLTPCGLPQTGFQEILPYQTPAMRRGRSGLRIPLFPFLLPSSCVGTQRPSKLRRRIGHQTVCCSAFVVFWQILSDWLPILRHEEETMTILIDLHVIARTNPRAMLDFLLRMGIEPAGA
jgi:hypothetical protein